MGLIIATAFAVFLLRTGFGWNLFALDSSLSPGAQRMDHCGVAGGCLLLPFAVVLPILALRDRRTPRRDVVQRPGFVSCIVVVSSAVLPCFHFASRCVYEIQAHTKVVDPITFYNSFLELRAQAGPAILGAWVALALAGRGRVRPARGDLAGCLVGLGFLLLFIYSKVYGGLWPFL